MKSEKNNPRRDFIKKSIIAAAGMSVIPGFVLGKDGEITEIANVKSTCWSGWD